jgi:hypothetical protein
MSAWSPVPPPLAPTEPVLLPALAGGNGASSAPNKSLSGRLQATISKSAQAPQRTCEVMITSLFV